MRFRKNPNYRATRVARVTDLFNFLQSKIKPSHKIMMLDQPFDWRQWQHGWEQQASPKPRGIWYSCGIEWIDLTANVHPHWFYPEYIYSLTIETATLKTIRNNAGLEAFDRAYGNSWQESIDWEACAEKYDGVEICPWLQSMETKLPWYFGWDVASGCIWNPEIILDVTHIQVPQKYLE